MEAINNMQETPELELFVFDFCPFGQRAIITLKQGAIPHRLTVLDPDNLPEWFSEVSPLGNVPVLRVNDQETVFESAVINDYLACYANCAMVPDDKLALARQRAWSEYAGTCHGAFMGLLKAQDEKGCQEAEAALFSALQPLEQQLERGGPYFSGEQFMTIDATYAPLFMRMAELSRLSGYLDAERLPGRVRQWQEACLANEAVRESVIGDFPQVFRSFISRKAGGSYLDRTLG